MTKQFFIILIFLAFNVWGQPHPAKLKGQLFTSNNQEYLALTIEHDKGWHTYWKNPGDAGLPTQFEVQINSQAFTSLLMQEWPVPKRYIESGDILAYGYSDQVTFFSNLPPLISSLKNDSLLKITAKWLVCKDVCIPGKGEIDLKFSFKDKKFSIPKESASSFSHSDLKTKWDQLPKVISWPSNLEIYLSKKEQANQLVLHGVLQSFKGAKESFKDHNFLTPFPSSPVGFKKENLYLDKKNSALYSEFHLEWDGDYQEPPRPLPLTGLFEPVIKIKFLYLDPQTNETHVIEKDFAQFSLTDKGISDLIKTLTPFKASIENESEKDSSFFNFYLFAFLGGLILNLMPCVLPVISIKLFGLIKYQNQPQKLVLKHNFAYTLGVLLSFWSLAAVIVFIKSAGETIGWGFQLQSPVFVFIMILVIFIFALNMFGLFEWATPGGKFIPTQNLKSSFINDIFSGILSTILSTPCSAPFLGTALTFAFTSSPFQIFLIFTIIGLGLCFPFLLTAFFPQLLHILPKPGVWMEKLKYILGLTLILTVIWLVDVFLSLVDHQVWFFPLMMIFSFIFFAFFVRKKFSPGWARLIFIGLPFFVSGYAIATLPLKPMKKNAILASSLVSKWSPWSEEKVASVNGYAFIDFTAEWCLTCKVNKKLVLDTESFRTFSEKHKLSLFRADWTSRDDQITSFLSRYKIVGVPAYFLKKPNGELIFLGETISMSKLNEVVL